MRDFSITVTNKLSKNPSLQCTIAHATLLRLAAGSVEELAIPHYLVEWALLPHDRGDTLAADHTDTMTNPPLAFEYLMIAL